MVLLRWKLKAEAEGKESSSMNKNEKGFIPCLRVQGPLYMYVVHKSITFLVSIRTGK